MRNLDDRCDLCGGQLEPGTATLEIWRKQQLMVIRDLPADVCLQCHEPYLSPETSDRLDRFMDTTENVKPRQYLTVPEYSALQALEGA